MVPQTRPFPRAALTGLAAALLAAGCGGAAPGALPSIGPAVADLCATPPADAPRDTVVIGLTEPVDPAHVPLPANDAERLVFRQLRDGGGATSCAGATRGDAAYRLIARTGGLIAVPDGEQLPVLVFRVIPHADPRDLLDAGVDLLVTRDAAALAYAERRPDLLSAPLEWDRTYVLVAPSPLPVDGLRGAVRAESRAPEPPFWWADSTACPRLPAPSARRSTRVAFPAGDPIARELAERVAAGTPGLSTAPLSPGVLGAALAGGVDAAYVLPLPRRTRAACPLVAAGPAGWSITPLVESRPRAVLRRGALRISADADGSLRIVAPGPP